MSFSPSSSSLAIKFHNPQKVKRISDLKVWFSVKESEDSTKEIKKFNWKYIISNSSENLVQFRGSYEKMTVEEVRYKVLLDIFAWLPNNLENRKIIVYHDDVIFINCINSWLMKWQKTDFCVAETTNKRPYSDYLIEISKFKKKNKVEVVHHFKEPNYPAEGQWKVVASC